MLVLTAFVLFVAVPDWTLFTVEVLVDALILVLVASLTVLLLLFAVDIEVDALTVLLLLFTVDLDVESLTELLLLLLFAVDVDVETPTVLLFTVDVDTDVALVVDNEVEFVVAFETEFEFEFELELVFWFVVAVEVEFEFEKLLFVFSADIAPVDTNNIAAKILLYFI